METLKERIGNDFILAMKNKDEDGKSALRGIKSKITEAEKAKDNTDLSDEGVLKVLASAIKQRKQSIEEYKKGNREDLIRKENAEILILEKYMPAKLSESDIEIEVKIILSTLDDNGNKMKLIGQTMGIFNKKFQGRAEGSLVKSIIEKILA